MGEALVFHCITSSPRRDRERASDGHFYATDVAQTQRRTAAQLPAQARSVCRHSAIRRRFSRGRLAAAAVGHATIDLRLPGLALRLRPNDRKAPHLRNFHAGGQARQ